MTSRLFPVLFCVVAVGAVAQPVKAPEVRFADGCALYDHGPVARPGAPIADLGRRRAAPAASETVVTRGSATFEVNYSGFSPEARAAFQFAVDIWADHVSSPVPIRVQAEFLPLDARTLGSAGPFLLRDFPVEDSTRAPIPGTWYPFALADAIAGQDLSELFDEPEDFFYDINATFNSSQPAFYFGLDGNPPPGQFDFVTIVLHELGHGLGFIGSGKVDDGSGGQDCNGVRGTGCWGYFNGTASGFPFVFDQFIEDRRDVSFLDTDVYPNPSRALGALLQSQNLFVDAPNVVRLYGQEAPVWAPLTFLEGSSFSHWDEVVFREGSAALMTPQVARGEAYQDPGDITCAFFQDMGWPLGAGCATLTVDGEDGPRPLALGLELVGPNPVRSRTRVRLVQGGPQAVRATLVDVLGRRVGVVHDGLLAADAVLEVDASALAPGAYRLVVQASGRVESVALTVVR